MKIIRRSEWGARHPNGSGGAPVPAREVWLHHSAGVRPDLVPPFDDDYIAVRAIEVECHRKFSQGMSYTFLVTPVGLVFEGHGVTRLGAHTAGRNSIARAICWVGNYEVHRPTEGLLSGTAELLVEGRKRGWWTRHTLNGGHRDVKATACPGRYAYDAIQEINHRAEQLWTGDDDMATPEEIWGHLVPDYYRDGAPGMRAGDLLGWAATHSAWAKEEAIRIRAELVAMRSALPGMVAEEIDRAIAAGVLDVQITVLDKTPES